MPRKWMYMLVLTIALGLYGSMALAQVDLGKALVGKWVGTAEGNRNRVLLIKLVTPKNGGWVAEGTFTSRQGNETGPVTIKVSLQDGIAVLEFDDPNRQAPVRLKLVSEKQLGGWEKHGRRLNKTRDVELKKIEQE